MNLSFPFFKKNLDKNGEYFFGLLLKEQEGIGIIMVKQGNLLILKTYEKFTYSNGWENLTQDIDDLLFKIEHSLQIQLHKTIFFVFSHLLDEKTQEIKKPFLVKIKEMVKSLDLVALGYIECYEAIANVREEEDEMPLSAIIMELDKSNISIFIYKSGKVVFSKVTSRTDNLVDDFTGVIEPVKKNFLLPARILLYDSHDLSEESTKFVSHRWSEEYFVQMPRITIVNEDQIVGSLIKIFTKQIEKKETKIEVGDYKPEESNEVMGFAIGADILQDEQNNSSIETENASDYSQEKKQFKLSLPHISINFGFLNSIVSKIQHFFPNNKGIHIPSVVFIVIGFIMIVVSIFSAEFFLHKAQITIYYPAQKLSKTLDINAGIDDSTSNLPITIATVSAAISESKTTTGKHDIGDKAKGEITLHSFDDKEKLFSKGLILLTGSLQYSLDSDVKVASASLATDGSAKLPGKAPGKVTALDLGTESNIDKGKRFTIADLSPSIYFAINEKAFAGGTKRQVNTVSKKDLEDLNNLLMNKAKNTKELMRQSTQKERIISDLTTIVLKDNQPSKEVGEESNNVTIKTNATATYYTFDEDKMISYVISEFKNETKSGFVINKENIQYKIVSVKLSRNNIIEITMTIDAKAIKNISKQDVIKVIKGKPISVLENIIKNNLQAEGYKINVYHPIPIFNLFMPLFGRNINLIIGSL